MIQINTPVSSVQPATHPRLAWLHRRYHDFVVAMSESQGRNLPRAATFIPSSGQGIAFNRPIAPIGSVLLTEFCHHTDPDDRIAGAEGCFRGYRGAYLAHSAETLWEPEPWLNFPISVQTYATAHDERLMRSPRLLDVMVGLGELSQRLSDREPADYWALSLPPTLLGFASDEQSLIEHLVSRPTVSVRNHAQAQGLSIEQAWQELDSMTRVEGDITMTGLRLIDARLCCDVNIGTDDIPEVLSAYHNLAAVTGRQVTNPAKKLEAEQLAELIELIDERHEPERAAQQLRRYMPQHFADGCSNADLIAAVRNPERPLIASRVARRQVW